MTTTDNTPAPKSPKTYDLSKIRAAITNARAEIKAVIDACVKDRNLGKGSPVQGLCTVDTWLTDTESKLENVGKPRAKKERKAKK